MAFSDAETDPTEAGIPHPGRTRRRRGPTLVAAAVALLAVATLGLVSNISPASALEGRRVCSYIEGFDDDFLVRGPLGTKQIAVKEWVGVNFSKDRDCPTVSKPFGQAGEMPAKQPVPKTVCERYDGQVGMSGMYLGDLSAEEFPVPWSPDICANMAIDAVYFFYVVPEDHPEIGVKKGDFVVRIGDNLIWWYQ